MNYLARGFLPILLLIFAISASAAADDSNRLLPATFTHSVTVEFKQDGRVLDVIFKVPAGNWVATRLVVKVSFASPAARRSATPKLPLPETPHVSGWKSNDYFLSDVPLETHTVDKEIFPGHSLTTHLELTNDAVVTSVKVAESRGRQISFVDRIKSTLR